MKFCAYSFQVISVIGGWVISSEIAFRWMPLVLTDDKSTLVQVMAWCRQATSHYLSQCWPRSLSPYGVTRPQWVSATQTLCEKNPSVISGFPSLRASDVEFWYSLLVTCELLDKQSMVADFYITIMHWVNNSHASWDERYIPRIMQTIPALLLFCDSILATYIDILQGYFTHTGEIPVLCKTLLKKICV